MSYISLVNSPAAFNNTLPTLPVPIGGIGSIIRPTITAAGTTANSGALLVVFPDQYLPRGIYSVTGFLQVTAAAGQLLTGAQLIYRYGAAGVTTSLGAQLASPANQLIQGIPISFVVTSDGVSTNFFHMDLFCSTNAGVYNLVSTATVNGVANTVVSSVLITRIA